LIRKIQAAALSAPLSLVLCGLSAVSAQTSFAGNTVPFSDQFPTRTNVVVDDFKRIVDLTNAMISLMDISKQELGMDSRKLCQVMGGCDDGNFDVDPVTRSLYKLSEAAFSYYIFLGDEGPQNADLYMANLRLNHFDEVAIRMLK